jgi:D-alanyl-D-alanine dipeptidase
VTTSINLVYIDDYGLSGSNFYFYKYANHGLTKEDITDAGLTSDRVQVNEELIPALQAVNAELEQKGWKLFIKEGYRSDALYEIAYKRRVEKYGKEETDSILNMKDRPHAKGIAVDVAIFDAKTNTEVYLRRGEDGTPALFIDFYKEKEDPESKRFQELQEYLIDLMLRHGFRLGTKREYFHFDYRSEMAPNR